MYNKPLEFTNNVPNFNTVTDYQFIYIKNKIQISLFHRAF